ncbi:MAG: AAA family ATPase [Alistipes sp.]|nr:AAA family ATPase [Alistipes sp.]
MDSNTITNPTEGIVKSHKLSNLTNEQLLRREELRRAEERVSPYIVDMTKELPDEQPLISIDGCCICSRGNISAICGEAKSKKTFLASALVASAMAIPLDRINNFKNVDKDMNLNVLWVDTEQGERHVRRVVDRISEMTGAKMGGLVSEPRLMTLSLRELDPMDRYVIMTEAIKRYPFDLIVIDGIADLQRNTNDLEQSDALVGALMTISTNTNTHILCVLHTNPGSDKARGHLGSALQRKAETVIFVHRNGECSVVEPQFCRNEPFERFAFAVNDEGIPEICDIPQSESLSVNDRIVEILNTEYGGVVERTTLRNKIMEVMSLNRTTALMRIKRLCQSGKLVEDDNFIRSAECHVVTPSQGVPPRDDCDGRDSVVRESRDECHAVTMSQGVPPRDKCDNVTTSLHSTSVSAQTAQATLDLDSPSPRPQYYGHYDADLYDDCPF